MTSFENPELNLVQLIEGMIHSKILEVHTATPGVVTKYDPDKQTADVQVAIKRQIKIKSETVPVPILKGVPVLFPRTGDTVSHFPLKKGDSVLLIFCERNTDTWAASDGASIVEPDTSPRFHDFNDAICVPGLFPPGKPMTFDTPAERDGHVTASELMKISLTSEGKILISRREQAPTEPVPLGNVLLAAFEELLDEVKAISTAIQTKPLGIGNLSAPVPIHPLLAAALGGTPTIPATDTEPEVPATQGIDHKLDAIKAKYVTDPDTNLVSKIVFTERGE